MWLNLCQIKGGTPSVMYRTCCIEVFDSIDSNSHTGCEGTTKKLQACVISCHIVPTPATVLSNQRQQACIYKQGA